MDSRMLRPCVKPFLGLSRQTVQHASKQQALQITPTCSPATWGKTLTTFSSVQQRPHCITVYHSASQYISQYRLPIADTWMTGRYVANSLRSLWCPRNCGTKLSDTSISARLRLRSIFHFCSHMLLMLLVLLMPGHSVLPPRRNPRGSCIKLSLD